MYTIQGEPCYPCMGACLCKRGTVPMHTYQCKPCSGYMYMSQCINELSMTIVLKGLSKTFLYYAGSKGEETCNGKDAHHSFIHSFIIIVCTSCEVACRECCIHSFINLESGSLLSR